MPQAPPPPPLPPTTPRQRTPAWVARHAHNPSLAGNFAPIEDEINVRNCVVEGRLPPSVEGVYLRNGPNPRYEPVDGHHWFGAPAAHAAALRHGE
jgi:carotenoid cleavage dioxygenase